MATDGSRPPKYCSTKCAAGARAAAQFKATAQRWAALGEDGLLPCRTCGGKILLGVGGDWDDYFGGPNKPALKYCSVECRRRGQGAAIARNAERQRSAVDGKECPVCGVVKKRDEYFLSGRKIPVGACKVCRSVQVGIANSVPAKYVSLLWMQARSRAKKKKLPFDITRDWLMARAEAQCWRCYYTGRVMTTRNGHGRRPENLSLDRVDSSRGYTKDNVVLCCTDINVAKQQYSIDHLLYLASLVADWRAGKPATDDAGLDKSGGHNPLDHPTETSNGNH